MIRNGSGVAFDTNGKATIIEEKPTERSQTMSLQAFIYFCPSRVPERANAVNPSARGELEINNTQWDVSE